MPSGSEDSSFDADPLARLEPKARLTVDERLTLVHDAIERYGEGFFAWVIRFPVRGSEPTSTDLFCESYYGWYSDRASFMADQLEHLDWPADLADLLAGQGMPPGCVRIKPDGFWERCTAIFTLEERLGGVHVFAR